MEAQTEHVQRAKKFSHFCHVKLRPFLFAYGPFLRYNGCRIDTTPLITHRYKLADIEEAYRVFEEKLGGIIQIAVEP